MRCFNPDTTPTNLCCTPVAPLPQVTALGIVSIFEQILGGLPEAEREAVFDAFISALQEDPAQYRKGEARLLQRWRPWAGIWDAGCAACASAAGGPRPVPQG